MSTFQLHASWIAALEWGPIARRLCLAPMFLLSFGAQASQWCREPELNVFGLSAHFYETRYSARRSWNEFNFGLGLTCQLGGVGRWHDEAEVGVFRNSFRRTSFYGGYGISCWPGPSTGPSSASIWASGFDASCSHPDIGRSLPRASRAAYGGTGGAQIESISLPLC